MEEKTYIVVRANNVDEFERKVAEYQKKDYKVTGGVSVTVNHQNVITYHQALTK